MVIFSMTALKWNHVFPLFEKCYFSGYIICVCYGFGVSGNVLLVNPITATAITAIKTNVNIIAFLFFS